MTVLLTRPEAENAEMAAALAADGIPSIAWPLTRIEPVTDRVHLPEGCRGLLVTSGNGLKVFASLSAERAFPVLAVGERTAALARDLGFERAESAGGAVEDLAALAMRRGLTPLYHPMGEARRGDLAGMLAPHGLSVTAETVYAARPTGPPPEAVEDALVAGTISVVTLWSPRNSSLFSDFALSRPHWRLDCAAAVAISEAAAEPLRLMPFSAIRVAGQPNRAAMLTEIAAAHGAMRR